MLVPSEKGYYEELVARASKYGNIKFIPPVDFSKIPEFINQFDIGVYILDNKLINAKYALPNKFFEFVQARLMVAVCDSFEMKNYIKKYDVGISASENTAESMASVLKGITEKDIMHYKQNAHVFAQKLSSEASIDTLCEIAQKLTA